MHLMDISGTAHAFFGAVIVERVVPEYDAREQTIALPFCSADSCSFWNDDQG